jgi:hypothetical protein
MRRELGRRVATIRALSWSLEEIQANFRRRVDRIKLSAQDAAQVAERVREIARLREELGTVASELAAVARIVVSGEDPHPVPGRSAPAPADGRYAGQVVVEVGPLRDFAQLTRFEDAASEIESACEVRISNFAGGRATFSMSFAQPVELVKELERRTPFPFSVRSAAATGVVLDVGHGGETSWAA